MLEEFDDIAKTNYDKTSGLVLNSPSDTGLPAQMSDGWIEYINKMIEPTANQTTREIGVKLQLLYLTNPNLFTKYVNAIDKSTGEIWFMKLNNF